MTEAVVTYVLLSVAPVAWVVWMYVIHRVRGCLRRRTARHDT